jgi:hypothetical protein
MANASIALQLRITAAEGHVELRTVTDNRGACGSSVEIQYRAISPEHKCVPCGRVFEGDAALKKHQECVHLFRAVQCSECSRLHCKKGLLYLRMRLRSEDEQFICRGCRMSPK